MTQLSKLAPQRPAGEEMMISKRQAMRLAAAAALTGASRLAPREAVAQTKMIFKASDVHPEGYPTVTAVEEMGKALEKATDGRLSVQMYASMQLGGEKEAIEQAQVGAIALARVSVGALGPVVNDLNVLNLPFLFRDTTHMQKVIDGPIGQELLDKVTNSPTANLVGLCWMDAGARNMYDTKRPIKDIADLKGLKVRVMGNPMFVDMMNDLGGNGVAMGYDQVFTALQTGVVDGAENNPPSFVFDNHYQAGAKTRPGSANDRTCVVGPIRGQGIGEDEGVWHPDRDDRRQEAIPGRGKAGLG
jgi:tripartite ATP-independent transporter DctP family solute receptor